MKRLLLAGAALSLLAVAAPPARSQVSTVAVAGTTCPATTQYTPGTNRPLIVTQTGMLCTDGSGGSSGSVSAAAGAFVDGWSVTGGSTTDVVCSTDTGTCTDVSLFKRLNVGISSLVAAIGTAIPAGTANIGTVGVLQGSTTSGQYGSLSQCAVTTAAPSYTTAQTSPLSCGLDGTLRVSAPASSPVNVTVTTPPNDVLSGPTNVTGATDVSVSSQGSGATSLQITGTFTGLSGTIQGSVDGTNYINIGAYNSNTGAVIAPATAITATGIYVAPAAGYRSVRYHVTAVSTGTAVVSLDASAGSLDPPSSVAGNGRNVNLNGINGSTPSTGNGVTGSGVQRVTVASDQTAFSVNAQPTPVTSGGLSTFSEIVPANTTSVAVKASAGQVYDIEMGSNSATPLSSPLYVKTYDAAQGSTTCGSGTPKARYVFTGGSNISIPLGEAYATAITVCVTAGIADNDATSPAATTFLLTVHYK